MGVYRKTMINSCSVRVLVFSMIFVMISGTALADTLRLKDSRVIEGTLISRDQSMVIFSVNGQEQRFPADQIVSIDLGAVATTSAQPTSSPKLATSPRTSSSAEVLSGTLLVVKISDTLDTRETVKGQLFSAVLEADLIASNGTVISPRGTEINGRVSEVESSGRLRGKPTIVLELTDITFNNKKKAIVTDLFQVTGDSATRGTVRRVLLGAVAGRKALNGLGDSSDAAKAGAKVGLGASILVGKKHIQIPAGTLLNFHLKEPFYD